MREAGAREARNKFGRLLDLVERGEEVTITRRGKPVARLTPLGMARTREEALAAIGRLRERAEARKVGQFDLREWKYWRDEGRR